MAAFVADDQQRELGIQEIANNFGTHAQFFEILYRLEGQRFDENILKPGVEQIVTRVEKAENKEEELLRILAEEVLIRQKSIGRSLNSADNFFIPYERAFFDLFEDLLLLSKRKKADKEPLKQMVYDFALQKMDKDAFNRRSEAEIPVEEIIRTAKECGNNEVIKSLVTVFDGDFIYAEMKKWLEQYNRKKELIEKQRAKHELLYSL